MTKICMYSSLLSNCENKLFRCLVLFTYHLSSVVLFTCLYTSFSFIKDDNCYCSYCFVFMRAAFLFILLAWSIWILKFLMCSILMDMDIMGHHSNRHIDVILHHLLKRSECFYYFVFIVTYIICVIQHCENSFISFMFGYLLSTKTPQAHSSLHNVFPSW